MKRTIEKYKNDKNVIPLLKNALNKLLGKKKITDDTSHELLDDLTTNQDATPEQLEIMAKLDKAHSIKERVILFAKIMDTYGIDPLISLIPVAGDRGINTIATVYLLSEGFKMGLSFGNMLKILGYQGADATIGSVPVLGTIVDFFFKGNKWSAKIFEKHFEKLKTEAIKRGVSEQDIQKIESKNKELINGIHNYLTNKKKQKNLKNNI